MDEEHRQILAAYRRRRAGAEPGLFGLEDLAHLYRIQERHRETMRLLKHHGIHPLKGRRILDVGCGDGDMIRQFLQWGAAPTDLAGIDLQEDLVRQARTFTPTVDLRAGTAARLPWPDESFDLVCQHTMFTSLLSRELRERVAAEMMRVARTGGAILWYDFLFDNPRNDAVRGIRAAEIRRLFPGCQWHLKRLTLAPFAARRLARWLPVSLSAPLYAGLAAIPLFCTHALALMIRPGHGSSPR